MSRAPTSSLVLPAMASSRSWIAAAPLSASPWRTPRSIQSIRYGRAPGLHHVAAERGHDRPVRCVGADDRVPQALEGGRTEQPGQRFEPVAETRIRRGGTTQIAQGNLARRSASGSKRRSSRSSGASAAASGSRSDPCQLTRNPFRVSRPDVGPEEAGPEDRP